ncbi:phospholipid scramblase 3 isoform X5 [Erinaceus europaeus]|uniref:Phospholipid scramblase 3 isoform X5 n=1 Tax=Erinaceus europaeus TaxID=9365 RepID=A0ABM3YGT7_ERIEU|nr:phospholipid scramblase 3 isoform X5 [Erinaceus europaeus]
MRERERERESAFRGVSEARTALGRSLGSSSAGHAPSPTPGLSARRPRPQRRPQGCLSARPRRASSRAPASQRQRRGGRQRREVRGPPARPGRAGRQRFLCAGAPRPGGGASVARGRGQSLSPPPRAQLSRHVRGTPAVLGVSVRGAALETLGWCRAQLLLRVCLFVFVSVFVSVWLSASLSPLLEISFLDTDIPRTQAPFSWQATYPLKATPLHPHPPTL